MGYCWFRSPLPSGAFPAFCHPTFNLRPPRSGWSDITEAVASGTRLLSHVVICLPLRKRCGRPQPPRTAACNFDILSYLNILLDPFFFFFLPPPLTRKRRSHDIIDVLRPFTRGICVLSCKRLISSALRDTIDSISRVHSAHYRVMMAIARQLGGECQVECGFCFVEFAVTTSDVFQMSTRSGTIKASK